MQELMMQGSRKLPLNFGPLKGANGNARITGPCGDTMEFWVFVEGNNVCAASYTTDGCENSIKSGTIAALLGEGASLQTIKNLQDRDVLCIAKDIPKESEHCALLAVNTLKAAVEDYIQKNMPEEEVCDGSGKDCSQCSKEECASRKNTTFDEHINQSDNREGGISRVKHKIMVLSGKGGVGKSTIAVNIALALASEGNRVGILDVDIHGPSIPLMLGVEKVTPQTSSHRIIPVTNGILKIMSVGFFLRTDNDPVIWRGPLKMSLIKQFLEEVEWGDLDYLVIDCPPGTGDEPLSVCQLVKNPDGAVIVTTPQNVAITDVRKSITFCDAIGLKVIGIIENMSGFKCPHCSDISNIFGSGGAERLAEEFNVPFLGRIPLETEIMQAGENAKALPAKASKNAADSFKNIITKLKKTI